MRAERARSLPEVRWWVNEGLHKVTCSLLPSNVPLGEVRALGKPPRETTFWEGGKVANGRCY